MATVIFGTELQRLTGEERTEVNAATYRELVDLVTKRYDALTVDELMKMAVAIDGEIIHDPLLEPVRASSEVHFLYRISGG